MAASPNDYRNLWYLTERGWEVARVLAVAKKVEGQKSMGELATFLKHGKLPH